MADLEHDGDRAGVAVEESRRAQVRIALIALLLFSLAALSAPLAPLFDPDEGYYPATAAETLRSAPFWDLQLNGAPRWEKPILSYALIEGAFRLFGTSAVAARIPSALEGAALVAIIGLLVARMAGPRAGVLSVLVVATTLGVAAFSKAAHPEIGVVAAIVTTELLVCEWLVGDRGVRRRVAWAAGVAIAYGFLAKGPVAIVLPAATLIGALPFIGLRRFRDSSALADAVIAASVAIVLVLPWYVAMVARHGVLFLREGVWQQNVARYTTGAYGHRARVFFFVLPTLVALLPWTGLLPQALGRLRPRAESRRDVLRICMAASAVTAFLFYSASSSKLASYALVFVPPLGILIALLLDEEIDHQTPGTLIWRQSAALLGLAAAAVLALPLIADRFFTAQELLGGVLPRATTSVDALLLPSTLALGAVLALASLAIVFAGSVRRRIGVLAGIGAIVPVLVLLSVRPVLRDVYPWEQFGRTIAERRGPVWLLGRRAPSLSFYAGRPVVVAPTEAALETEISPQPEGWIVLTTTEWSELAASSAMAGKENATIAESGQMVLVRFGKGCRTARR